MNSKNSTPTSKNTQARDKKTRQAQLVPDFIEWISDGLVVFDAHMNITYANQKGGEILGQSPEELKGKNFWKEYPEKKDTPFAKACQQALESQSQGEFDEYDQPLGRWIQYRLYPSKEGLAICFTDITEHKKVETALQKSEEKYRHLVETAHDLIWALDAQGRITFINQAAREVYGYEPEELIGHSYLDLLSPEKGALEEQFRLRQNARHDNFVFGREVEIVHRDGTRRTLLANAVSIFDEGGNFLGSMGTSADITERRKAEDALRENTEFLFNLLENSPVSIYITGSDNRIRLVNRQWEIDTGIPRTDAIEHSLDQVFPADIADRLKRDNQKVIEAGAALEFEEEIKSLCFLTVKFPLRDASGKVTSIGGISVNITDRKQAAAELRNAQKLFEKTFASLTEAIFVIDSERRNIIACNPAVEHIFGYKPEEIIGQNTEFLHVDHDAYVRFGKIGTSDLSEKGYYQTEYRMRRKDGEIIITENTVSALFENEDRITGVVSVVRDITERKKMEEALQRTETLFRAVLNSAPLTIFATDKEGKFTVSDGKGLERTGLKSGQDVGLSVFDLYGSQQLVGEAGEELSGETIVRRALNGEMQTTYTEIRGAFYENRVGPLHDKDGDIAGIVGVSIDVTERVKIEEERKRQAARAEMLARTARRLNQQLDLEAVIQSVCQEALEAFDVFQCAIALYDEDQDWLAYAGGENIPPEEVARMEPIPRAQFDEIVEAMGSLIIIPNVQEFPGLPNAELNARLDIRTVIVSTMARDKELIGTLTLGVKGRQRSFTPEEQTLLKALSDQAAQAIMNAKLLRTANEQRTQLRLLSAKLAEAQEAERHALTNELHDRVGQNLTALSINLQNLKGLVSGAASESVASKFDDAQELVQETTRHIRDIMAELHPPELEDYGLAAALETYAERAASRGNLKLQADLPDLSPPLPVNLRIVLYRAAQEAISNVLKHAGATKLKVSLRERKEIIHIRVEDNGRGFEPNLTSRKETQTWGLKIMQERIESVGGVFRVESTPGKGTRVTFEAPRPPS